MDLYPEPQEGYEWRVVWFPPDKPQEIFYSTEERVRKRAEMAAEWNPLIERRPFSLGSWEDGNG